MLSDELEALAADAIVLFGISLKTGGLTRKLRRLAVDARKLEAQLLPLLPQLGAAAAEPGNQGAVVSIDHARRQKRLTQLAERGEK